MDLKTGMIIMGEFAALGLLLWGVWREERLVAFERAVGRKIRARLAALSRRVTFARMEKINKKALYTPVKPPKKKTGENAA